MISCHIFTMTMPTPQITNLTKFSLCFLQFYGAKLYCLRYTNQMLYICMGTAIGTQRMYLHSVANSYRPVALGYLFQDKSNVVYLYAWTRQQELRECTCTVLQIPIARSPQATCFRTGLPTRELYNHSICKGNGQVNP